MADVETEAVGQGEAVGRAEAAGRDEAAGQASGIAGVAASGPVTMPGAVTLGDIFAARKRIAPFVRRTPLILSERLSARAGAPVSLKLESLQVTNAFKARGAFNAALSLRESAASDSTTADSPASGSSASDAMAAGAPIIRLVTASSGNHGRALSHAARMLGFACTVFAPSNTPKTKLDAIRANGAALESDARDYDAAEHAAKAFAAARSSSGDERAVYISPYNDPRIVAGTGTIALELFDEQPDLDTLVVPLGGGGLISGIATAAKAIKPGIRVIGVEAAANPAFHTTRRHGRLTPIPVNDTLADGLGGNIDPDSITLPLVSHLVDAIVLVEEAEIARSVRDLAVHDRIVTEGAGAIASAALSIGAVTARAHGGRIAAIVTGSNIDGDRLSRLLSLT